VKTPAEEFELNDNSKANANADADAEAKAVPDERINRADGSSNADLEDEA
jgi:hypothetical protein